MDGTKLTLGTIAALAMAAAARGRKGERNVNAAEQLQASFHTRSNRQDFSEYYPQSAAGTLEVFRSDELHKGEKVAWAGTPGRMLPVDRRYVHPVSGNIFDQDKFSAIAEQVKAREPWEDPLVFHPGYAQVTLIGRIDIAESIQYAGEEWGQPFTTGDEELDAYLAQDHRGLAGWLLVSEEDTKRLERELKQAERRGDGDFGKLSVQMRDGNHRTFGALAGGESHVYVNISDNDLQQLFNDRERTDKLYRAIRAAQRAYGATQLKRPRQPKVRVTPQLQQAETRYRRLVSDEKKLARMILEKYDQYNRRYTHLTLEERSRRPELYLRLLLKDMSKQMGTRQTVDLRLEDPYFLALRDTEAERRALFDKLYDLRKAAGLDPRTGEKPTY